MEDKTKVWIIGLICFTIIIIFVALAIGWIFTPDVTMTFQLNMDNNTREVFELVNITS